MENEHLSSPTAINILLADSKQMESQLVGAALRQYGYKVIGCENEANAILNVVETNLVDVAVVSCGAPDPLEMDIAPLRTLHLTHPEIPKLVLMESENRELAVQAFRNGAPRTLFALQFSVRTFLCVHRARAPRRNLRHH
jgi:PleD family two-component response regulator